MLTLRVVPCPESGWPYGHSCPVWSVSPFINVILRRDSRHYVPRRVCEHPSVRAQGPSSGPRPEPTADRRGGQLEGPGRVLDAVRGWIEDSLASANEEDRAVFVAQVDDRVNCRAEGGENGKRSSPSSVVPHQAHLQHLAASMSDNRPQCSLAMRTTTVARRCHLCPARALRTDRVGWAPTPTATHYVKPLRSPGVTAVRGAAS